jgi:predicted ATPase
MTRKRTQPMLTQSVYTPEDEAILQALPDSTQAMYSLADTMDAYWINKKIDDGEPNYRLRQCTRAGRSLPTREYMRMFFAARDGQ